MVLDTSKYFFSLAYRHVGPSGVCQKRLLIVFGTSFLSIARKKVETSKCGQERLLIVLGTSQYFHILSL